MLLVTNSLILIGEGLSLLSYKYTIRDILRHKYINHIDISNVAVEDGVKYSKIMLRNLLIYNVLNYYNYRLINIQLTNIKYVGYLLIAYAYYNRCVTQYILNTYTLKKKEKYILGIGFTLTSIGLAMKLII